MNKLKFNIYSSLGKNRGLISSYHRQRGRKKLYRIVDFWRTFNLGDGSIVAIEQDSYRTAPVFLVNYLGGIFSYVLGVDGLKVGDRVGIQHNFSATEILREGFSYKLDAIPVGGKIFNLELYPGKGGKVCRSAGTFAILIKKYESKGLVKLSSGEYRLFSLDCLCTYGRVGNVGHKNKRLAKAGISRLLGKRPVVRGRAMNPIDHPHGGRTNGGIQPKTPWGKLAKGTVTRKKRSSFVLKRKIK